MSAQTFADAPARPLAQCELAAWSSITAAVYALAAGGALLFLSAGFESVASFVRAVGSFAPAQERLAPFVGLAVVIAVMTLVARPLAQPRVAAAPDLGALTRHLLAVLVIGLLLAFPPLQWLTFGRPDPAAAHQHGAAPHSETSTQAEDCEHGEHAHAVRHAGQDHEQATDEDGSCNPYDHEGEAHADGEGNGEHTH